MPIIYQCDGCGGQEEATFGEKPKLWFVRDITKKNNVELKEPRRLIACCRTCVETVSAKYEIDGIVSPI